MAFTPFYYRVRSVTIRFQWFSGSSISRISEPLAFFFPKAKDHQIHHQRQRQHPTTTSTIISTNTNTKRLNPFPKIFSLRGSGRSSYSTARADYQRRNRKTAIGPREISNFSGSSGSGFSDPLLPPQPMWIYSFFNIIIRKTKLLKVYTRVSVINITLYTVFTVEKERNPLQEGMWRTSGPQRVYNPIGMCLRYTLICRSVCSWKKERKMVTPPVKRAARSMH